MDLGIRGMKNILPSKLRTKAFALGVTVKTLYAAAGEEKLGQPPVVSVDTCRPL